MLLSGLLVYLIVNASDAGDMASVNVNLTPDNAAMLPVPQHGGEVCRHGTASQYSPGVMERVVKTRQSGRTARDLPRELPPVDGYIAVLECNRIGEIWRVFYKERWESFLVADCAGSDATRRWMTQNNILIEVDYLTAKRWGVVGRGAKVEVCHP